MFARLNISKVRSYKLAFVIVEGIGKIRFRANAVETANRLNVRKNINVRKPTVSKKNNMVIFISKEIVTKRNAIFN